MEVDFENKEVLESLKILATGDFPFLAPKDFPSEKMEREDNNDLNDLNDLNDNEDNDDDNNEDIEYVEVKRPVIITKSIINELNIIVCNTTKNKVINKDHYGLALCDVNEYQSNKTDDGFQYVNHYKKRNEGFYILANKVNISKHLKKTKFCNIYIQEGVCGRKVCNFAHSMEEYNFPHCAFENNCKVPGCRFKHPYEELEKYKMRINFKLPNNIE